jgi:hypothetical protein
VAPSTGIHCNGNGNVKGNVKGNVNGNVKGNVKGNCNGRCAERQGQMQRSLRGQGQLQRTHGTLVWQDALDRQHVARAGWAKRSPTLRPPHTPTIRKHRGSECWASCASAKLPRPAICLTKIAPRRHGDTGVRISHIQSAIYPPSKAMLL